MKFYKRFPGDITIKTGDLTLTEFGAYDRLLDHYYAKERPIEAKRAYTVARCQTADDRRAVDRVLAEFWTLTDDGWVQQRADEMIAEALPKIEAARENGKKGGRPKGTNKKPTGLFAETKGETKDADSEKASQSQSLSSPSDQKDSRKRPSPIERPADVPPQLWDDWTALRRAKKAPVTATVVSEARVEAQKAGMDLEAFLRCWCVRGSQGLQAEWLKPNERGNRTAETARVIDELTGGIMSQKHQEKARAAGEIIDV